MRRLQCRVNRGDVLRGVLPFWEDELSSGRLRLDGVLTRLHVLCQRVYERVTLVGAAAARRSNGKADHAVIGRKEDEERTHGRIEHAHEGDIRGDAACRRGGPVDGPTSDAWKTERHVLERVEPEGPTHLATRVAQLVEAGVEKGIGRCIYPGKRGGRQWAAPRRLTDGGADACLLSNLSCSCVDCAVALVATGRGGPHARRGDEGY
eukprot:scaffold92187_cov31-Tisochrysis_lutea.AAC.1